MPTANVPFKDFKEFVEKKFTAVNTDNLRDYKIEVGERLRLVRDKNWPKAGARIGDYLDKWLNDVSDVKQELEDNGIMNIVSEPGRDIINNLAIGGAAPEHAYAYHYRMHADAKHSELAKEIDRKIFGGKTYVGIKHIEVFDFGELIGNLLKKDTTTQSNANNSENPLTAKHVRHLKDVEKIKPQKTSNAVNYSPSIAKLKYIDWTGQSESQASGGSLIFDLFFYVAEREFKGFRLDYGATGARIKIRENDCSIDESAYKKSREFTKFLKYQDTQEWHVVGERNDYGHLRYDCVKSALADVGDPKSNDASVNIEVTCKKRELTLKVIYPDDDHGASVVLDEDEEQRSIIIDRLFGIYLHKKLGLIDADILLSQGSIKL